MKKTKLENRLPAENDLTINTKVWKAPVLIKLDVKQTLLGSGKFDSTGSITGECDPATSECP